MITDNLNINKVLTVLVLGDSHTQNGLDVESSIPNSLNLSSSAESYFFSYNKLKYFIDNNLKIEKLVLGVGAHSLSKSLDSIWVKSEDNFLEKFRSYSPIMDFKTIPIFFNQIGWRAFSYIKLLPSLVYQPFYTIERKLVLKKLPFIGGFDPNFKQLRTDSTTNNLNTNLELGVSELQIYYLEKIISLCEEKNIELIFLNVPVFSGAKLDKSKLNFPSVKFLDYGDLWRHQEFYFADYVHLNEKGAKEFSSILAKELGFKILNE